MNVPRNKTWPIVLMLSALLAVVVFGAISFFNTRHVRTAEQEIAEMFAIREATRKLYSTIVDTETGQRGYVITGEQEYLEPYDIGLAAIEDNINGLRALLANQPEQLDRVDRIAELTEEKKSDLKKTISIRSNLETAEEAFEKTRAEIMTHQGKKLMDRLRALHQEILDEADRQLEDRQLEANNRAIVTQNMIVFGNVLALGLAALSGLAWYKSNRILDATQQDLVRREAELAAILNEANEGIVTFDDQLRLRFMNPMAEKIHQVNAQDVIRTSILMMVPKRFRTEVRDSIEAFFHSGMATHDFEGIALRNDGSEFPYDGTLTRSRTDEVTFVTMMFRDLSNQKEFQAMFEQQSLLLDRVRDAIQICDMEDRVVYWNQESERLFGIRKSDAIGNNLVDLIYHEYSAQWSQLKTDLLNMKPVMVEWKLSDQNGQQVIVEHRRTLLNDWQGNPSAQLIINVDVTDRVKGELRARRAQRLESIGTLAGGVAHDLNNVLSPILMAAKLLKREKADTNKLADTIVMSSERGAKMISKLLAFAGGEGTHHDQVQLAEIIRETELIIEHALPKQIELTVHCDRNLKPIDGNATELSQVVMNLAINARDAMRHGGKLEIRVQNATIDATKRTQSRSLEFGEYVRISVSDTGTGISPDVIEKIFDPFFTTKTQGEGTGLGLATTMGIVRSHGGEILVFSEVGFGTTMTVFLPISAGASLTSPVKKTDTLRGCGQTILLVDDESLILETSQASLELNNYRVLIANGGAEAVAIYQQQGSQIDLVILDVMMPGMDGLQTKASLRSINPKVKIIASSGLRRPGTDGSRLGDVDGFLPKPYSDDQLYEAIANVWSTGVS